jgi:TPR repeat protein
MKKGAMSRDDAEAIRWYRKAAADHKDGAAQAARAFIYREGGGVPADIVKAHLRFDLAASGARGEERAGYVEARDRLTSRMTASQVAQSRKLARKWKPRRGQ